MTDKEKEYRKQYRKKYYEQNKDYFKEHHSSYMKEHYQQNKNRWEEHYKQNKEIIKEKNKEYWENNKEYLQQQVKNWSKENREYVNEQNKKHRKKNPAPYKWRSLLKDHLKRLGGNKSSSTHDLLKYSALELKEHLDKQNMNWETDHIDHKVPITWFKNETPPHITNDLRNLQPLNETANKQKLNRWADKIDKEYYNIIINYIKEEYKNKIIT